MDYTNQTKPQARLASVKNTAEIYKDAFTVAGLRWLIFNSSRTGFDQCLKRVGRKILIDLDAFEKWIDQQAQGNASCK